MTHCSKLWNGFVHPPYMSAIVLTKSCSWDNTIGCNWTKSGSTIHSDGSTSGKSIVSLTSSKIHFGSFRTRDDCWNFLYVVTLSLPLLWRSRKATIAHNILAKTLVFQSTRPSIRFPRRNGDPEIINNDDGRWDSTSVLLMQHDPVGSTQ